MHALIDADIFTYSFGSSKDDEGNPLNWPFVASRLNAQIESIKEAVGATSVSFYLTGAGNFRVDTATIKPYKGTRPKDKPHHYGRVRSYLLDFYKANLIEGMEADDAMSIEQMKVWTEIWEDGIFLGMEPTERFYTPENYSQCTIICSIDKDLMMVPGWHYNWIKDEKIFVSELDGLRSFYRQLLTGDSVDNIPGLHGVGPKSTHCLGVTKCSTELEMYTLVREQYEKRFGSYWSKFMRENAALLWMCRVEDYLPMETEIFQRLSRLEDERNKELKERDEV